MEKNQIGSVGRSSSLHEVRQIVDQAIRSRLQHSAPDAVLAVEQRDDEIYVAVNSGGNLIACSNALLLAGWRAVPDDEYVGYGCAMRVTRRSLGLPVCRRGTPLASCPNEVVLPTQTPRAMKVRLRDDRGGCPLPPISSRNSSANSSTSAAAHSTMQPSCERANMHTSANT